MATKWVRAAATTLAFVVIIGACGSDDGDDETATDEPTTAEVDETDGDAAPTATTAPEPEPEPDPTATPEPEPEPTATPEPAFEPPATILLDDPKWTMEPPDLSYRVSLLMTMRAELADGSVQEGRLEGEGGKLLEPTPTHSMVVDFEGLTTVPADCADLALLIPDYTSAYFTLSGGLSGDDGGDLFGEAALAEAGIMNNGVVVDRYAITLDNVDPNDADEYVSFDEAYIDIAREGDFVVSIVLSGLGFNNTFSVDQSEPRPITYDLDFSEFGTIEEFSIPPGCQPN